MTSSFKSIFSSALIGGLLVLSGCSSVHTRVTLLPQEGVASSAVEIKDAGGKAPALVIDKPYAVGQVTEKGELEREQATAESVAKTHGRLLSVQPPKPVSLLLYFQPGGSTLTEESQAKIPEILAQARQRQGGEIVVTGHTDSQGAVDANDQLSLKRAQAVRELFIEKGFAASLIEAVGRGKRQLLVPTGDNVAEPRNRRVEILIR